MIQVYYNHDFVCREVDMIPGVHGICLLDEEGRANIYLNRNDTDERKLRALKHELLHYILGDHYVPEEIAEARVREMEKRTRLTRVDCGNT